VAGLAVLAAAPWATPTRARWSSCWTADGRFYFMEMNTRIQVEHTITETITGVDIVEEQIRIAAGLPLRFKQHEIGRRGFAIQFRINAEDPKNNFLPSFGRISRYYAPGGPGVRTDGAIYTGYNVPPYYDSMLAKVIVWALNWDDVIEVTARRERALRDMGFGGVIRPRFPGLSPEILRHPRFPPPLAAIAATPASSRPAARS
jgi:pyruvate carboxylase subunit A